MVLMDTDCIEKACSVYVDMREVQNDLVSFEYFMCRTDELTAELRNC